MFDSVTSRILLDSTRTIRPWNLQRPSGFLMEYESMGMGVPSAGLFLSPFCQAQRVDRRIVRYKMIGLYLLDNWWLCEWGLVGLRFFEDSLNFELALRWEIWSWNFLDPRNRKKLCKQAWFPALILSLRWQKIPLNQWPCNRNPNWRYLAYIFGLCFMAKFQGISPQFLCPKMWYVYDVPPYIWILKISHWFSEITGWWMFLFKDLADPADVPWRSWRANWFGVISWWFKH